MSHQEDGRVVVRVQRAQLRPLPSEHDEDSVEEIEDLGHVEHPQDIGHGWVLLVVSVADGHVPVGKIRRHCPIDHVRAKGHLRQIVHRLPHHEGEEVQKE